MPHHFSKLKINSENSSKRYYNSLRVINGGIHSKGLPSHLSPLKII
jgi:hypothetical protein